MTVRRSLRVLLLLAASAPLPGLVAATTVSARVVSGIGILARGSGGDLLAGVTVWADGGTYWICGAKPRSPGLNMIG